MGQISSVHMAVVSFAFPIALVVVVVLAYLRVRLKSLLWLLGLVSFRVLVAALLLARSERAANSVEFDVVMAGSVVITAVFLTLLMRELRALKTAAARAWAPSGGESPGAP